MFRYAEIVLKRMLTESQQQHGNASKRSVRHFKKGSTKCQNVVSYVLFVFIY